MSEKLSPKTLLPVAIELFKTVGMAPIDKLTASVPREEKLEARIDEFIKFYHLLRDKLQVGEE